MGIELVKDANGNVKLDEKGIPVWITGDGKEIAYDVDRLVNDLSRVNNESAGRRKEIDTLNEKMKPYEGIDPEKARVALELTANLDAGKLVEAGKVEELKASIGKSWEQKVAELEKARVTTETELTKKLSDKDIAIRNLLVKGAFQSSEFLREKTFLPPDIAFDSLGKHFEVIEENGELRVLANLNGQPIFSSARPGNHASPEEAIQVLVEANPCKERILRTTSGGSGTTSSVNLPKDRSTMSSVELIESGLKSGALKS